MRRNRRKPKVNKRLTAAQARLIVGMSLEGKDFPEVVHLASGYHRSVLGGGNALKAVTRARRSAPSRKICGVKTMKPPVWRAELRKQREALDEQEAA